MAKLGKLYLIPTLLNEESDMDTIPGQVVDAINSVDVILSEKPKATRAFLKKIETNKSIQEYKILQLDKHVNEEDMDEYLQMLKDGLSVGIVSEVGCPAVADPGNKFVYLAHKNDVTVVSLVGPSSILLALMASGLSGQNFAFVGYVPKTSKERIPKIKSISNIVKKTGQTQIIIETPYRCDHLFEDLVNNLAGDVLLCIAVDLTMPSEFVKTKSAGEWKSSKKLPKLRGKQVTFLVGV